MAATLTLSFDARASRLVRSQARLLLRAHVPLLAALEKHDRAALEQAALELFVTATSVFGRLAGELIGRTAVPLVPKSRKGRARAR